MSVSLDCIFGHVNVSLDLARADAVCKQGRPPQNSARGFELVSLGSRLGTPER